MTRFGAPNESLSDSPGAPGESLSDSPGAPNESLDEVEHDEVEHDAAALAVLAYELAVAIGPNGITQRFTTVVPEDTMYLEKRVRFKKQDQ